MYKTLAHVRMCWWFNDYRVEMRNRGAQFEFLSRSLHLLLYKYLHQVHEIATSRMDSRTKTVTPLI